ncbi:ornithine aminotransferase [Bordetella genomosp. 9]|uniref:Ornithine aminotransferase n=1 Tax=Bordetella genomosp. 9 TaxID=1416803 RepID=A0A261R2J8_9BORD|nr:BON domain-containing protein [Bordetella genomosp. 9]OZI18840.1 ornithine aminotransferase [Bordetella genomosp. 9]
MDQDRKARDDELRQHVIDAMAADPAVDAAHVGVSARDGIVTLSGAVANYTEKFDIERIVRKVRGVHGIAQEIAVRHAADKQLDDDQIAERALSIIKWSAGIPEDNIQVTVQHGWVTLDGQVPWHFQRMAAEMAVRKLSGVTGITNHIELQRRIRPDNVQHVIEAALRRDAEVEAAGIHVTLRGDTAVLEGHVSTWHEKSAAERACWSVPGIQGVENNLVIRAHPEV